MRSILRNDLIHDQPVNWGVLLGRIEGFCRYRRTPGRAESFTNRCVGGEHRDAVLRHTADVVFAEVLTMSVLRALLKQPAMRLYLIGHALILVGAGFMEVTNSVLPMAVAASASLMLMAPLVKQLSARYARVRSEDSRRR